MCPKETYLSKYHGTFMDKSCLHIWVFQLQRLVIALVSWRLHLWWQDIVETTPVGHKTLQAQLVTRLQFMSMVYQEHNIITDLKLSCQFINDVEPAFQYHVEVDLLLLFRRIILPVLSELKWRMLECLSLSSSSMALIGQLPWPKYKAFVGFWYKPSASWYFSLHSSNKPASTWCYHPKVGSRSWWYNVT